MTKYIPTTNMNNEPLKTSLSKIWALVYRATQKDLDFKQLEELCTALNSIRQNWPENDSYHGKANWMCDLVDMSGILSMPSRKPRDMEAIMEYCQRLLFHLDSN